MLKAFTWQDFFLVASLLSLLWWAGVGLRYYRRPKGMAACLPHAWELDLEQLDGELALMGNAAPDHGAQVLEADEFSFAAPAMGLDKGEQLGDLADLQQEIKDICGILATEDGTKEDFFVLFEMLRTKYPKMAGTAALGSLNGFIREHVPFSLTEQELEGLWL